MRNPQHQAGILVVIVSALGCRTFSPTAHRRAHQSDRDRVVRL